MSAAFQSPDQQSEAGRKLPADAETQFLLGVAYANGVGVAKDEAEAVKWYRKAAEQNHAQAQYNLGVCYAQWPRRGEG